MLLTELGRAFRDFRPGFWPTAMTAVGVAVLVGLGTWQVVRLVEKNAINAHRAAQATGPAIDLPAAISDPEALDFRRVRLVGRFDHARELHLACRSQRGNDGICPVTPLLRADGPPVLVNRGWVPSRFRDPAARAAGQVGGTVTIEGILRTEPRRGWLMPDNDPVRNVWLWFDLPAMARAAGVPGAAPFYVEAGPAPNPGGYPLGGQTMVELPNNHLQYAITWYALAIVLLVIYVMSQRVRPAGPRA
ncbi:MAG: SURF1 family protein [Rhodospirillales bacterium]|nr:SURF1 family protein [Rhodospirillales bacterium]